MKTMIIIAILTLSTSCGYRQTMRHNCHLGTTDEMCDNLFGQDEWVRDDENKKVIESLQSQIDGLVAANDIFKEYLAGLESTLVTLQTIIAGSVTMSQYDALQAQINSLNASVDNIQIQVNNNTIRLAELESEDTVVEYIYPCGEWAGHFNEILMLTRSGAYVAYFESGSNRFLTTLKNNVTYRLTDGSNCTFTLSNGIIINSHR